MASKCGEKKHKKIALHVKLYVILGYSINSNHVKELYKYVASNERARDPHISNLILDKGTFRQVKINSRSLFKANLSCESNTDSNQFHNLLKTNYSWPY